MSSTQVLNGKTYPFMLLKEKIKNRMSIHFSKHMKMNRESSTPQPENRPIIYMMIWTGEAFQLPDTMPRSEEHTSELQSRFDLVCRLLLEKKKKNVAIRMQRKDR